MAERDISRRDILKVAGLLIAGGSTAAALEACGVIPPSIAPSILPSRTPGLTPSSVAIEATPSPSAVPTHEPTPKPTEKPTPRPTPEPTPEPMPSPVTTHTPEVWIKYQGPQVIWHGDETRPNVYLTMDDGFNASNIDSTLKIANENGIKMTFCPIGRLIGRNPGMYKEIVSEGHDVQNHTFTHSRLDNKSNEQIKTEVLKARDALWNAVGFEYPQSFLRPPGEFGVTGISVYEPLLAATQELGYRILVWDISSAGTSYGATSATAKQVAQIEKNVETHMHNGGISLQHAINVDVAAFPDIVSFVKRNGWKPITIREGLGKK